MKIYRLAGLLLILGFLSGMRQAEPALPNANAMILKQGMANLQFSPLNSGNIIYAASCSLADVQEAVDTATEGDTVMVPAGTDIWTNSLLIEKEITLQGAGIDKTIIVNAYPENYSNMIRVSIESNTDRTTRITGFTFKSDKVNELQRDIGISGDEEYRIDHCKFTDGYGYLPNDIAIRGYKTAGVIDHCIFDAAAIESILVTASNQTWAEDPTLGSIHATFVENCTFMNAPGGHAITSVYGAKTVFRYNKVYETDIDVHGHCFNRGWQSARHYEIYENDIYSLGESWRFGLNIRGGTGVIFDNRLHKTGITGGFFAELALTDYRVLRNCPNDGCGQGGEGYPLFDQIGRGKNQTSEPLYIWNNMIDTNNDNTMDRDIQIIVRDVGTTSQCGPLKTSDFIKNVPHDGQTQPDYYDDGRQLPNYVPYTYPHPLTWELTLYGTPGNRSIQLNWDAHVPLTSTWAITYDSDAMPAPISYSNLSNTTHSYNLTDLNNHTPYTITLTTVGIVPTLSDTIIVIPTDQQVHLPLIRH